MDESNDSVTIVREEMKYVSKIALIDVDKEIFLNYGMTAVEEDMTKNCSKRDLDFM